MRCAPSLQSLNMHFIFLGGMPPRIGRAMCRVEDSGTFREARVAVEEDGEEAGLRCLPAWKRRMEEVEAEVRRERRWTRVDREVSAGIARGTAGDLSVWGIWRRTFREVPYFLLTEV